MKKIPCIHIGYPKAASKTLQYGLFKPHSEIAAEGKPFGQDPRVKKMLTMIYAYDSLAYNRDAAREAFEQCIAPLLQTEKTLVISWELFTLPHHADRGLIADRIRDLFGETKILINIRRQLDEIVSLYSFQYSRAIHSHSFKDFVSNNWNNYYNGWFHNLDYDNVARKYTSLFGKENVGVFLFEDLIQNPQDYARRVCNFIGVDPEEGAMHIVGRHENRRRSSLLSTYTRFRKLVLPQFALRPYVPQYAVRAFHGLLDLGPRRRPHIPDELAQRIQDRFRESNLRLSSEFGLPLESAGYPV